MTIKNPKFNSRAIGWIAVLAASITLACKQSDGKRNGDQPALTASPLPGGGQAIGARPSGTYPPFTGSPGPTGSASAHPTVATPVPTEAVVNYPSLTFFARGNLSNNGQTYDLDQDAAANMTKQVLTVSVSRF